MTDARAVRPLTGLAFALLATSLVVAGYWLLFTTFMIYDDEGYVLISLRNFSEHGGLYNQVYTQYGPFPYLLYDALHRVLGFAFDNTSGRWITLVNWTGAAAISSFLVYRTTRSSVWAAYALAGTFTYLWVMIHEPIHPGGLITFLIAFFVWIGAEGLLRGHEGWLTLAGGLTAAALLMTKVNVGIFFCGALFLWIVIHLPKTALWRSLMWLAAVGCVVLPFGLMRVLFDAPWVRLYAVTFATAALGLVLASLAGEKRPVPPSKGLSAFWWMVAGIIMIAVVIMFRGTSPGALIAGVLLDPLKQPSVYFFPVRWRMGTGAIALSSLALAAAGAQWRLWNAARFKTVVIGVRVILGAVCLIAPLGLIPATLAVCGLSYGVSLAWLFVVPMDPKAKAATTSVRMLVAAMLVFQSLQAYPVAGSQLNWGTCLWLSLIAMGLHDAAPEIHRWLGRYSSAAKKAAVAVIVVPTLFMAQRLVRTGWNNYHKGQPLTIAGANGLRLPNDLTYALRIADENLRTHADVLFSFPGLYSANIWTGLPTPTLANTTHWFSLLSTAQQQEIIERIEMNPRTVVLVQRDLLDYLARQGFRTTGPLHDWLIHHFQKTLAFGGYEIWVRTGRSIAGLWTARATTTEKDVLQELKITAGQLRSPVDRVELCNIDQPDTPLIGYSRENATIREARCDLEGHPIEPFDDRKTHALNKGPLLIDVAFAPLHVTGGFSRLLVVLRDQAGRRLGDVLIAE